MTDTNGDAVELDDQVATDVALLAQLNREIRERAEIADEVKARLREQLQPGRKYRHNGRDVLDLGKSGDQFDPKVAAAVIPVELQPACSVPKLDGPTAKRVLPGDLYAQCCRPKAPAVKPL